MSKIVVYGGGIIDSVRITYNVENAPTPLTVQHGGPGGHEVLSFDIAGNILCFLALSWFTSEITLPKPTKNSLPFMVPGL